MMMLICVSVIFNQVLMTMLNEAFGYHKSFSAEHKQCIRKNVSPPAAVRQFNITAFLDFLTAIAVSLAVNNYIGDD